MSLYRTTSGTAATVAAAGTITIPANPNRLNLLLTNDGLGRSVVCHGSSLLAVNVIACLSTSQPTLLLNNVNVGERITGAFVVQNNALTNAVLGWTETEIG